MVSRHFPFRARRSRCYNPVPSSPPAIELPFSRCAPSRVVANRYILRSSRPLFIRARVYSTWSVTSTRSSLSESYCSQLPVGFESSAEQFRFADVHYSRALLVVNANVGHRRDIVFVHPRPLTVSAFAGFSF